MSQRNRDLEHRTSIAKVSHLLRFVRQYDDETEWENVTDE